MAQRREDAKKTNGMDAVMNQPGTIDVSDLIGVKYEDAQCYALARRALARVGTDLPEDAAELVAQGRKNWRELAENEVPMAGDLVWWHGRSGPDEGLHHVGVVVSPGRFLHTGRETGSQIGPLAVMLHGECGAKVLRRVDRNTSGARLDDEQGTGGAVAEGLRVSVVEISDVFVRGVVRRQEMMLPAGSDVALALHSAGLEWSEKGTAVLVKGALATGPTQRLNDGDEVTVVGVPGGPISTGMLIMILIAAASAVASVALAPRIKSPGPTGGHDPVERRYEFSRYSQDAIAGDALQVVFGTRRYGGKVISVIPGEGENGNARLRMLIRLSRGPVSKIAGLTSDTDNTDGTLLSGIYLNDQPISGFPGARVSVRMGSTGQTVIPGFADTQVLREVGVGGTLLRNTSGTDRTSGTASGEAVLYSTVDPVDSVSVRIRFAKGLSSISAAGQTNTRKVTYRVRTRTSDVGSGAGTWGSWNNVVVERAEQSEFVSAKRIDGLGLVKTDVQAERLTAEPTDVSNTDAMTFDSVVETRLGSNTYAGFAQIALDLAAGEQLTSVPRVSVDMDGYAGMRVWDGVSSAGSPTFTTGFSANPAAIALEMITNATWGMGAVYPFSAMGVDTLQSLFDWWTYCDGLVAKNGGGTRKRYACNLVADEARDGIDWLRAVCGTGECTPATVGNQWRFIVDRPSSADVERFDDSTISVDSEGVPEITWTRELATGGVVRDNRLTAQFENARADFRNDVVSYPALAAEWLATEPVRERQLKMDGETDPEQVYAKLQRRVREVRLRDRTVSLRTTKPYVVVQPGEVFGVACQLAGIALASGRLVGSTASLSATTLVLDRSFTLPTGGAVIHVTRNDNTLEVVAVRMPPGYYTAGSVLTVDALSSTPVEGESYSIVGTGGTAHKRFICTRVGLADAASLKWEVEGVAYDAGVYDESASSVPADPGTGLWTSVTAPGPVLDLKVTDRLIGGVRQAVLSWSQQPVDQAQTAAFRVARRLLGTTTWVTVPTLSPSNRSTVVDIVDIDIAVEFAVVAESSTGARLNFADPRVPAATVAFGLSAPPLAAPANPVLTQTGGNTYTLSWDAVSGAVQYQVLFGGDTTGLPNVGAEDCLVLGRVSGTELAGLELPPGRACRFYVRSVNSAGRLSWSACTVNISTPATPAGQSVKNTKVFSLNSEGTLTNLTWDSGQSRLELTSAGSDGVYLGPIVDTTTVTANELTWRPGTANDAADPTLDSDPFQVPSIAADQWGNAVSSPATIGMLMPPYPDAAQTWLFEVTTYDGSVWSNWEVLAPCASIQRTFSKYQCRVTMRRAAAPYRPSLRGLAVVVTA